MTLRERYKSLNNPNSVKKMVITSVYSTMYLEGQTVPEKKIESLYNLVEKEKQSKKEGLVKPG